MRTVFGSLLSCGPTYYGSMTFEQPLRFSESGPSTADPRSAQHDESVVVRNFLRELLTASTVGAATQAAVDAAREVLSTDVSWSGVLSGDFLTMAAHSGLHTVEMAAHWRLKVGQGLGGRVAAEGRTLACRDYLHDPRRVPVMKTVIDREGIRGGACAPLLAGSEVLGVLYVSHRSPREWSSEELGLLSDLARDTGTVLDQIRKRHHDHDRANTAERHAYESQRAVEVAGTIAMSLTRTDDISVALGILAHNLGLRTELLEPDGEVLYSAPPGNGHDDQVQTRVMVGDEPLAMLRTSGNHEPTQAQYELLTLCADMLALCLLRQRAAVRAESRVHSELLDNLLDGHLDDRTGMLAKAALLGVDLKTPRYVACVGLQFPLDADSADIPPSVTREQFDQIERRVRDRFPHSALIARSGDVVLLLEADSGDLKQIRHRLHEVIVHPVRGDRELSAGLGRICVELDDYADSYGEAALALDVARRRPTGEMLSQDDLGLYGLLARLPARQSLESMMESALGPLIEADSSHGSEYVKTLHAYLDADRHLERTANRLHVHPNTVRYRLAKAQRLLGVDLRDVNERFLLELALRVQAALEH